MAEQENAPSFDRDAFREVVKHPGAHALVLSQYRIGEYAGVVALNRLLGELDQSAKLRRAMEIHLADEDRHTRVFSDWMQRLGTPPPTLPADVEAYFSTSREEYEMQRAVLAQLTPEQRRILVFAGINAVERLAFDQFENHLLCLDRREDVEALKQVMQEERFHLNYVEAELDRQVVGEQAAFAGVALEQARERFAAFNTMRRAETAAALERLLGGTS
jgi:rubrerythrin